MFLFAFALALLGLGCRQNSEQLLDKTLKASREAEAAATQQDAKRAMGAAERAIKSLRELEKRAETDGAAKDVVGEARLAVLAAQNHAALADEHQQRRDRLASLKAKTYRASRGLVIRGLCSAAAFGADKVAANGTNDLTLGDWNLTQSARELVSLAQGLRPGISNVPPNWTNVAVSLRSWATNPPPEANIFLTLSLLGVGQRDLALAEMEMMSTNGMTSSNAFLLHHGTRALVYGFNGWSRLAVLEVEQFAAVAPGSDYPLQGEETLVWVHAIVAADALLKRDWRKADEHIAECVKLSPNNYVVVYLTGERLAANGEWQKAAESLEASAASADDKWIAERLAQRARDLRDGKGDAHSLVLDPKFLVEVTFHLAAQKAKNSEAARKLESLYDQSGKLGGRFLEKLPL